MTGPQGMGPLRPLLAEKLTLNGLIHWWDTSQSIITYSGANATNVEDLIGSSDLTDATGPTLTTLNGHPVLESYLTRGNSANTSSYLSVNLPDFPQPFSFLCVYARRNTGLGGALNGTGAVCDLRGQSGGFGNHDNPLFTVDTALTCYYAGASTNLGTSPAFNTPQVLGVIGNGASSKLYVDGALMATVNIGTDGIDKLTIFNEIGGNFGHDLYWMEAQISPNVEPSMPAISAALLSKWN